MKTLVIVVTALASGSLGVLASEATQIAPQPVQADVGDKLEVHYTYYDATGRILYSTRPENAPFMAALRDSFGSPYIVPLETDLKPAYHIMANGTEPEPFVKGTQLELSKSLLGKGPGSVVRVPVLGTFAGFEETKILNRTRGPFNLTYEVATEELAKLAYFRDNGTIRIDDLLEGTVLSRNDDTTTFALNLEDDEILTVRRAGFTANVELVENDQFMLHLNANEGDQFSLLRNCQFVRYILPAGTYRINEVTETQIHFDYSPIPYPQLVGVTGVTGEYHVMRLLKA